MKIKDIRELRSRQRTSSESLLRDTFMSDFDKYDTTGDGYLGKDELTNFFAQIIERKHSKGYDAKELALKFIQMIDINGDGRISKEEIYNFYKDQ